MPISRPDPIPKIGNIIWSSMPKSILDVGIGFGIWGTLFRAWTDIRLSELDHERYDNWKTIIDGIEIYEGYRNPAWKVYSSVYVGDALLCLVNLGQLYDHIHIGDMIEHLNKDGGEQLINLAKRRLSKNGTLTIVTPNGYRYQDATLGNRYEMHLSGWSMKEMEGLGAKETWISGNQLVAIFKK